jgi:hypothetical protein
MIDFARSDPARFASPPPLSSGRYVYLEDARERRGEQARLGDEIARLSAHIQAATYRLLELIRAFDASEGWRAEGFLSCAGWLSWRTGIAPGAAREKVRVARALGELPVLSAALERGELSYSVARAITRVASPENEADLVDAARHATAAQMERLVGGLLVAERAERGEKQRHADRALWVLPEADGSWTVRGRLTPEVGALLCRALEAAGETLRGSDGFDPDEPAAARRADGMGLVAEAALANGAAVDGGGEARVATRAERFQVVVHVSAETLWGAGPGRRRTDLRRSHGSRAGRTSPRRRRAGWPATREWWRWRTIPAEACWTWGAGAAPCRRRSVARWITGIAAAAFPAARPAFATPIM